MRKEVKLGEICNILNGYAFKSKEYVEDGIRIIRITNVQKGIIQDTDPKYYKIDKIETLKNYMLKENDLLISLTGNVGRVGQISKDLLPAGLNQRVGCIRIKEEKDVSIDYLYQYLNSYNFERDCINNSKGIAQKNLSTEWLKNYKMKIPSLDEQKRIAIELRHIQRIKDLKQQQLKELEQLIKSQFVEMFELEKYELEMLGGISNFIDYRGKTPTISDDKEVRIVNAKSVGKGFFKYIDEYITEDLYEKWMKRGVAYAGDVLFVTEGHTFGNTCLIPDGIERFALGQRVITIQGKEKLNNIYLCYYMQLDEFINKINIYKTGGTAKGIRSKDLAKITIPVPPITLQNQFSEIVKQIDKQKFEIEKSLKETQELYESLMEKYFG